MRILTDISKYYKFEDMNYKCAALAHGCLVELAFLQKSKHASENGGMPAFQEFY